MPKMEFPCSASTAEIFFKFDILLLFFIQVSFMVRIFKIATHLVPAASWDAFHAMQAPSLLGLAFSSLPFPIVFF